MDEQVEETTIQVLVLTNKLILISEIQEVLADIGQPDCRLINPHLILDDQEMVPWMSDYTDKTEIMLSSDKILTLVEPKGKLLDNYLKLIK
jgi:hypothetical protein